MSEEIDKIEVPTPSGGILLNEVIKGKETLDWLFFLVETFILRKSSALAHLLKFAMPPMPDNIEGELAAKYSSEDLKGARMKFLMTIKFLFEIIDDEKFINSINSTVVIERDESTKEFTKVDFNSMSVETYKKVTAISRLLTELHNILNPVREDSFTSTKVIIAIITSLVLGVVFGKCDNELQNKIKNIINMEQKK